MSFTPTPEQADIIAYDPAHLRVAAGAGTGKTTTIIERLAHFIELGTAPTRMLGITFTVKAADELRTRLRERVAETGRDDEIEVATYHGFASSILDEFGALIGHRSDDLLMDDGHRYELGQLVLRTVPTSELDLTAMPQRVEQLMQLNDGLDRQLRTPDDLLALAPKTSPLPEPWPVRQDLAALVAHYRAEKRRLGLIEFSDLISRAVALVQGHPQVAEQLRERYELVVLDEYQDTDPAQRILLTTLFGDAAVTAVGDTDQTIYEWRGASLDNFEAFPDHFRRPDAHPTETLPLSVNRRSDRLILDVANSFRASLPSIEGSQPLTPVDGAPDGSVRTAWFRTERDEATWIARDILDQHAQGVPWAEIAVLVRKRAWIPALIAALRRMDVPVSVSDPGTLLAVPEVADVVAWLRVVADPDAEVPLLRILLGGQYRLGLADVAALRRCARANDERTIFGSLGRADEIAALGHETRRRIDRFLGVHDDLMRYAQANTVANTINRIIEVVGFWEESAALPPGDATTSRLNISRFMDLAHRWRPIEGRPSVQRFLRYVDALDMSGRDEALTPPVAEVDDAIELTTIHGAKGLEWDVVYLPGMQKGDFPGGVRKFDDPDRASGATVVPYELRLDADSRSDLAAADGEDRKDILRERERHSELRLAYVAVTRARHGLVLSGHAWQESVLKPKEPSEFLLTVKAIPGVETGPWCEDAGEKPPTISEVDVDHDVDPVFTDGVDAALRSAIDDPDAVAEMAKDRAPAVGDRVDQMTLEIGSLSEPAERPTEQPFSTSVTNLVALAECPLRFKWIHHDRMPRRPSGAARRGTEFHRKVEFHNLGRIALDDAVPYAYDAVHDDAARDTGGRSDPWTTFEQSRFYDEKARFTEVPFEIAFDRGSVRGKIDAVYELEPGHWEIVDYKSGVASPSETRRVQLQAYAVAAEAGAFSRDQPESLTVTFAYFGGEAAEEISEVADEAWLDEARSDLAELVRHGADGPFTPTPSSSCRTCDFRIHCPAGQEWLNVNR